MRASRRGLVEDDRIGVLFQHSVVVVLRPKELLDAVAFKPRVSLIQVDGEDGEVEGHPPLDQSEEMEQRPRVLAAGDPHEDAVAGLDQPKLAAGSGHQAEQSLLEDLHEVL